MTGLLLAAILTPICASIATLIVGWRRATATLIVLSAVTVLGCGVALGLHVGSGQERKLSMNVEACPRIFAVTITA